MIPPYFFDVWSLGHIALWGVLGFFTMRELVCDEGDLDPDMALCLAYGLMVGIAWEIFEWAIVEPLLGFKEPWYNRFVTDLFVDVMGTLAGASVALDVEDM